MNRQKEKTDITREEACIILIETYPKEVFIHDYMDYYAFPYTFANTGGPFCKAGGVYGQVMTTFTIEAWVHQNYAVLFCDGRIFNTTGEWEGVENWMNCR